MDLTDNQKKELTKQWFKKAFSFCDSGTRMKCYDPDLNVYPCHRIAIKDNREKYSLPNYKVWNTFHYQKDKSALYSANQIKQEQGIAFWLNWCPAANLETSDTVFYQSAKYNVLITEFNRFIDQLGIK